MEAETVPGWKWSGWKNEIGTRADRVSLPESVTLTYIGVEGVPVGAVYNPDEVIVPVAVVPPPTALTDQIGFARATPFTVALNCSDCSGTKSADAGVIAASCTEAPASGSGATLAALHPERKPIITRRPVYTRIRALRRPKFHPPKKNQTSAPRFQM